ncbi:FmdB family zinc ribbon protein [Ramlibacter sp.]|uniref:FmdB family zinc ribbon protein n=1 Tax=Ramlibacter sp. TaxID=1917967 RepID=UPI0017EF241E|nr:FmdB family zinc ribbon protein [Ramlibacter sp.]MBA2672431.1 zinc ribbon domain-containing protein [Ramlibacter sp.]
MPIYAYKCGSCGHSKDVLQKISDAPLTVCPACGAESFSKQVTAAGFQLKGSGWYATDFRNGSSAKAPAADQGADKGTEKPADKPADSGKSDSAAPAAPAAAPAASPKSDASGT